MFSIYIHTHGSVRFCCALLPCEHYARGYNTKAVLRILAQFRSCTICFLKDLVHAVSGIGACFELNSTYGKITDSDPFSSAYQAIACQNSGLGFCPDHVGFWVSPLPYCCSAGHATLRSVFAVHARTYSPLR